MGWSSGVSIFDVVAQGLEKNFPGTMGYPYKQSKQNVLEILISELEDGDCDTLDEGFGVSDAGDDALVVSGYHKWVHGVCDWNEDYSACINPKCGWKQR